MTASQQAVRHTFNAYAKNEQRGTRHVEYSRARERREVACPSESALVDSGRLGARSLSQRGVQVAEQLPPGSHAAGPQAFPRTVPYVGRLSMKAPEPAASRESLDSVMVHAARGWVSHPQSAVPVLYLDPGFRAFLDFLAVCFRPKSLTLAPSLGTNPTLSAKSDPVFSIT
jgi:hypothetical protein